MEVNINWKSDIIPFSAHPPQAMHYIILSDLLHELDEPRALWGKCEHTSEHATACARNCLTSCTNIPRHIGNYDKREAIQLQCTSVA